MVLGQLILVVAAPTGVGSGHAGVAGSAVRVGAVMIQGEGMVKGRGLPGGGIVTGRTLVLEMNGGARGGMAADAVGGVGCGMVKDRPGPGHTRVLVAV